MALLTFTIKEYFVANECPNADMVMGLPINLRYDKLNKVEKLKFQNKFSVTFFKLPLFADLTSNMKVVASKMRQIKDSLEYYANYELSLLCLLFFPAWIIKEYMGGIGRQITTVFSNVPGPKHPISYQGSKSKKLYFFVIPGGGCGISVGVYSHQGVVKLSLTADRARIPDA